MRDLRAEREARSLAIEKAYVHDVYEQVIVIVIVIDIVNIAPSP